MFLNRKTKWDLKIEKKAPLAKTKYSEFLLQSSNALHHTHNIFSSTKNVRNILLVKKEK